MTARQVYEAALIELNKAKAPSMLLEDFNYFFNKSINQYINKKYNIYDTNQQSTDDVRVLKSSAVLEPIKTPEEKISGKVTAITSIFGATYDFNLPSDYLHLLNCICIFKITKKFKCYDANTYWQTGAKRLTADIWPQIINNFYMRPTYKNPYYYIHNVNNSVVNFQNCDLLDNSNLIPTNPINITDSKTSIKDYGTDPTSAINIPTTLTLNNGNVVDTVEKDAGIRYGNSSNVRLEIRYGKDNTVFQLENIMVDYLKAPQYIRITQEQLDTTADTSQVMEFPDYVCQEIINELVNVIMENSSDPRLQTHPVISQSIANPAQAQAQPQI